MACLGIPTGLVQSIFDVYDKDNNDSLEVAEFEKYIADNGFEMNEEQLGQALAILDKVPKPYSTCIPCVLHSACSARAE